MDIFLKDLVKVILKLTRKTLLWVKTTEPIESFRRWCYFDDSDLVCLSEYVLHLSRDIFLSHGPCFHHLTHHSNHFNEAVIMLKRGLRGLDDTSINQAHWAGLFYALDSRDWQREEANKGRKSEGPSEKSKMHVLKTGLSAWLLRKSLSKDCSILRGFIITHQIEAQTRTWTCRAYPVRVRTLWDWPGDFLNVYASSWVLQMQS